jgi:hypothetical protein
MPRLPLLLSFEPRMAALLTDGALSLSLSLSLSLDLFSLHGSLCYITALGCVKLY